MEKEKEMVNIAPSSTHGHFMKDARKVVELDRVNETFWVDGPSKMVTTNHTTVDNEDDCLVTCQTVQNHFLGKELKSSD